MQPKIKNPLHTPPPRKERSRQGRVSRLRTGWLESFQLALGPGKFHGQRNLVDFSPQGCKESDTTEWLTLSLSLETWAAHGPLYLLRGDEGRGPDVPEWQGWMSKEVENVDFTRCSRRRTDQPLVRTSKLGQDRSLKNSITHTYENALK